MAEEVRVSEAQAEAAGESIHLPGPSYQPALVAFGATLAVVGVVLSEILVAIGLVIIVVTVFRWIRDTRSEISELPLEH